MVVVYGYFGGDLKETVLFNALYFFYIAPMYKIKIEKNSITKCDAHFRATCSFMLSSHFDLTLVRNGEISDFVKL